MRNGPNKGRPLQVFSVRFVRPLRELLRAQSPIPRQRPQVFRTKGTVAIASASGTSACGLYDAFTAHAPIRRRNPSDASANRCHLPNSARRAHVSSGFVGGRRRDDDAANAGDACPDGHSASVTYWDRAHVCIFGHGANPFSDRRLHAGIGVVAFGLTGDADARACGCATTLTVGSCGATFAHGVDASDYPARMSAGMAAS
mmetsp:Transcript_4428/g.12386  ORF Transcript_4428/g.12386 Transcript_4428/m.12386 type:complete len:201 (+) Transcript_4428:1605-2207(+)